MQQLQSETPALIGIKEVAIQLGVSKRTVATWTSAGWLPSYKIGRIRRYKIEECLLALERFHRKGVLV